MDGYTDSEWKLDEMRGASQFSFISAGDPNPYTHAGEGFRYLFQLAYSSDIIRLLSSKDYGTVTVDLLKDLGPGFYIKADDNFNMRMKARISTIIDRMFHTTDLSKIFLILNSGSI